MPVFKVSSKSYVDTPLMSLLGKNYYIFPIAMTKKHAFNLKQPHALAHEHIYEFCRVVLNVFL